MPTRKSLLGRRAECLAAGVLRRMGYRHVERNFRCRQGEIDIIAWDGNCLAFVEVRSHAADGYGAPAESIGPKKRARLYLTAQTYLAAKGLQEADCRFDVVEVVFERQAPPQVEVIQGAFDAPEDSDWS